MTNEELVEELRRKLDEINKLLEVCYTRYIYVDLDIEEFYAGARELPIISIEGKFYKKL